MTAQEQQEQAEQNILAFAQIVNRLVQGYRAATKQAVPEDWANMSESDQKNVKDRVMFYLTESDVTVSSMHDAWVFSMIKDGWTYGPAHDTDKKTHPMLVQYAELPLIRRVEDTLFMQTVQTLSRLM